MSYENSVAPAVPLPRQNAGDIGSKPPVWSISESAVPAPLPSKCFRHEPARSGVCCKELKGDDERTLVDPDVVRDVYVCLSRPLTSLVNPNLTVSSASRTA